MKKLKKSSLRKIIGLETDKKVQSSFVSLSFLLPKERIIFKTNPHWLFVTVPEVALVVVGILILKYLPFLLSEDIPGSRWLMVLFVVAWGFVMTIVFLHWICIKYYLTNLRLVEGKGIIGKKIMSVWLDRIQDVTCEFGILGRIFGFGDIQIESAGTYGKIVFSFLPKPRKLWRDIEKAILDFS